MTDLFSSTLYAYLDPRTANWVVAFNEDGTYYVEAHPESDFYVPVPDAYATREAAEAAIAVITVWEADGKGVLALDALRATPEWAALLAHMPHAIVPDLNEFSFADALDALPGAYDHYRAMGAAGVQVR